MQTGVFTKATCLKNVSLSLQSGFTLVWIKGPMEFSIALQWWWFGTAAAPVTCGRFWKSRMLVTLTQSEQDCSEQKLMWNDYVSCLS